MSSLPQITARLTQIRIYPIKSLDAVCLPECAVGPGGGLRHDREWAPYSADGQWVNAKRTAAVQLIRAQYATDLSSVTLAVPGDLRQIPARTFAFPQEYEEAAEWFSLYFDQQIVVRASAEGFPDDPIANGPTVISTASLQAVCEWFPGLALEEVRRRFRASLEVEGVPAFWEDRLFSGNERNVVRFRVGEVQFEGSNPCARCPVPGRDSLSGRSDAGFQKTFYAMRENTLPDWAPRERFDHFYRLATNTRVASTEAGKVLRVGDGVEV